MEKKNLNKGKLGLKAFFEKEKTKVHTTRRCRICVFKMEKNMYLHYNYT